MFRANDFNVMFFIGPIPVPWYGFLLSLGFLFFTIFSYFEWRKKEYKMYDFLNIIIVGVFFALFGARWWYLIFNPRDIENIFSFISIIDGRSILGSIFFSTIWLKFYINRFSSYIEFRRAFSILLPNILLAQSIGRWGNFFEQDVYGNIAQNNLIFLPEFIRSGMFIDGYYRQPLFLYESILDLTGWIIITFFLKNISKIEPGVHGSFYFIWYGSSRSIMELFRDDKFIMKIGSIPTSFILSILFLLFGLFLLIYYQFFYLEFELGWNYNRKNLITYFKKNTNLFLQRSFLILDKNEYIYQKNELKRIYYKEYSKKINLSYIEYFNSIKRKY